MEGYEPSIGALQRVVEVFDEHDITLHIDAGEYSINFPYELSEAEELLTKLPKDVSTSYGYNSYWQTTLNTHFNKDRKNVFRYCIYINQFIEASTLGIANGIPGNSFISAKGKFLLDEVKEAANFMHELGHTLGLTHGGAKDDHYIYKPNHLSIMNYLYSNTGLYPNNEINYSEYELPDIDKNHIDERKGIDPEGVVDSSLGCKWYFYQDGERQVDYEEQISNKSIDFNRNEELDKNCQFDFYFGNPK